MEKHFRFGLRRVQASRPLFFYSVADPLAGAVAAIETTSRAAHVCRFEPKNVSTFAATNQPHTASAIVVGRSPDHFENAVMLAAVVPDFHGLSRRSVGSSCRAPEVKVARCQYFLPWHESKPRADAFPIRSGAQRILHVA